jgi:hypothetical protein
MGKSARWTICIVGLVLGAVAIWLGSLHAFWSPDSGARFAMVRNLLEHGNLIHWHYGFRAIDPTGEIHPLSYFLFHRAGDFVPQYEPLFPLLSSELYACFGFIGLAIIPLASGIATTCFLYRTALRLRLQCAHWLPLSAGLGTPIAVYSVVFWDHSLMFLVAASASFFILRGLQEDAPKWTLCAGTVFGLGIFVHELVLAVFLATLLGALPLAGKASGRRLIIGLVAGFLPMALLWIASNSVLYGNYGGPHLSTNMGANTRDHPFSIDNMLNTDYLLYRSEQELIGLKNASMLIPANQLHLMYMFLAFTALLVVYFFLCLAFGTGFRLAPVFWLAPSAFAVYLVCQTRWANGLFEATPLVIPALAVPWFTEPRRSKNTEEVVLTKDSLFLAWISRSTWIFILMSIANPMLPGVDWGSRYLLPVLPYLVIMSAYALELQYNSADGMWKKAVAGSVILLVGMSVYCQSEGLLMIQQNVLYNSELNNRIAASPTAVVVYTNVGIGPEATADTHMHKIQFMVRSTADWLMFHNIMRQLKQEGFTFVGSKSDSESFSHNIATDLNGNPEIRAVGETNVSPDADEEDVPQVLVNFVLLADAQKEPDHG